MEETFITESAMETQQLGETFAKRSDLNVGSNQGPTLQKARIFALYGELGSGKTTFVQGLAKGLGIARRIISPTFVIVRSYRTMNYEPRTTNFYHIDLYRVENERDLEGLGIQEILEDPSSVVAVEWPERLGHLLPKDSIAIHFAYKDLTLREITISSSTDR